MNERRGPSIEGGREVFPNGIHSGVEETHESVDDEELAKSVGAEDVVEVEIPGLEEVAQRFTIADILPLPDVSLKQKSFAQIGKHTTLASFLHGSPVRRERSPTPSVAAPIFFSSSSSASGLPT